jgi:hypothetical protein
MKYMIKKLLEKIIIKKKQVGERKKKKFRLVNLLNFICLAENFVFPN